MAKDPRTLAHGEKRMSLFTSEKGRDRANAQRAIAGLSQNDQIIALLTEQNALLSEQVAMLHYICDRMAAVETNTNRVPQQQAEV